MLDANHHLKKDMHQIKKEPKPTLEGKMFTCEDHVQAELNRHCQLNAEIFCVLSVFK
jgi:hypothetical protein